MVGEREMLETIDDETQYRYIVNFENYEGQNFFDNGQGTFGKFPKEERARRGWLQKHGFLFHYECAQGKKTERKSKTGERQKRRKR